MHFKAAECGVLLEFAVALAERDEQQIPFGSELVVAGRSLTRYMDLMRTQPRVVEKGALLEMFDCMQRHLPTLV